LVRAQRERSALGGALAVASDLPAHVGTDLAGAARAAFTHGLDAAALGAAIAMVLAAACYTYFFRGVQVVPDTKTGEIGTAAGGHVLQRMS
jgi:MFS transporter, DHA2 family, multidrug resistance protein